MKDNHSSISLAISPLAMMRTREEIKSVFPKRFEILFSFLLTKADRTFPQIRIKNNVIVQCLIIIFKLVCFSI